MYGLKRYLHYAFVTSVPLKDGNDYTPPKKSCNNTTL